MVVWLEKMLSSLGLCSDPGCRIKTAQVGQNLAKKWVLFCQETIRVH